MLVAYYLLVHQSPEGENRQEIEENIADQYLIDMQERETKTEGDIDDNLTTQPTAPIIPGQNTDSDFTDGDYYTGGNGVTYTPEYAKGYLDCVLEIPSIKLRRGVYGGTWDDINANLDIWMVTTARPDYVLGETPYCIYGHNHTSQYLSFNQLQSLQVGEYFTLTKDDKVYYYRVTDFFAEWREIVTKNYVNNKELSPANCYIFTCGRREYRYKDIVVVGTLVDSYKLSDWNANKNIYLQTVNVPNEQPSENNSHGHVSSANQISTKLNIQKTDSSKLEISLIDRDNNKINGVTMAILNSDGLPITDNDGQVLKWISSENYVVDLKNITTEDNMIVVGVYEGLPSEYKSPYDIEIKYSQDSIQQSEVDNSEIETDQLIIILKYVIIAMLLLNLISIVFVLVKP